MLKWFTRLITSQLERKKVRNPEDDYVIVLTDESIEVMNPDGTKASVRWDDIQTITLMTTDQGPFLPDVWFELNGTEGRCLFPQGAPLSDEAYQRISQFDGFDFEVFINAMSVTDNALHLLWQRKALS